MQVEHEDQRRSSRTDDEDVEADGETGPEVNLEESLSQKDVLRPRQECLERVQCKGTVVEV